MKLRGFDLALAQITSSWQDSLQLFEDFQEECEDRGLSFDLGVLVRAMVVFATNHSRFLTVNTIPVDKLKSAWETTKDGIQFAANFLFANAGIEDLSLLSSPIFIITLAYYFNKRGKQLTSQEERDLKRWLYVASAHGHYSGSSESTLDSDLAAIVRGGASELLSIRNQLGRLEISPDELAGRGRNSPLFPMVYLALKARGAKDWGTQLGLSLSHQGRRHVIQHHHIFPKSQLKGRYETSEINEIANMAFISGGTNREISFRSAEDYLADILKQQHGKQALESHCIPVDPNLWKIESFRDFLKYRRTALAQAVNDFILGNPLEPQEINVEKIVSQGESEKVEFKATARWDTRTNSLNKSLEKVIVKSLAGFLNKNGGLLVLGVDDKGALIGLEKDYATLHERPDRDGYQQFLVNLYSMSLGRDVGSNISISFHQLKDHDFCVLNVRRSSRPVWVEEGIMRKFYIRSGNTTQELNAEEATEYIRTKWPR